MLLVYGNSRFPVLLGDGGEIAVNKGLNFRGTSYFYAVAGGKQQAPKKHHCSSFLFPRLTPLLHSSPKAHHLLDTIPSATANSTAKH